jgi:predicted ATPase
LRQAINSLRKVLHDKSISPHYISTVCKRGYRFLADVAIKERYLITEADETSPLHYRPQSQATTASLEYTNELTDLQEAFQKASNGERQLVFLKGEQGIGKTALPDTFLANANHPQLAVLRALC